MLRETGENNLIWGDKNSDSETPQSALRLQTKGKNPMLKINHSTGTAAPDAKTTPTPKDKLDLAIESKLSTALPKAVDLAVETQFAAALRSDETAAFIRAAFQTDIDAAQKASIKKLTKALKGRAFRSESEFKAAVVAAVMGMDPEKEIEELAEKLQPYVISGVEERIRRLDRAIVDVEENGARRERMLVDSIRSTVSEHEQEHADLLVAERGKNAFEEFGNELNVWVGRNAFSAARVIPVGAVAFVGWEVLRSTLLSDQAWASHWATRAAVPLAAILVVEGICWLMRPSKKDDDK